MATIELYANKICSMPGLFKGAGSAVMGFRSELMTLKNKSQSINKNVCNLEDVVSQISTSTQTQEKKMDALNKLGEAVEQFASEVEKIDSNVASTIDQGKEDFYDKYSYLKPANVLEQFWDSCKSGLESAAEWCKEHWVMVVTVLAVIAIAVVAVVSFGVAIPAIAAIAGIVSLALTVADVICMGATGGKSISDLCRENGMNWLGEIFDGVSAGCDIVSIAFPAAAAIKTMSKVGVKAFGKGLIQAAKYTYRDITEKIFKSGFKDGVKNTIKIAFKTFVFDIDDISRVDSTGKRVFDIFEHKIPIDIPENIKINYGGLKPDGKTRYIGGEPDWPRGNNGVIGKPSEETLYPGIRIDRYGEFDGSYVAPEGTPFKNRSLPSEYKEEKPYNLFEVNEALDVESGRTASWFGQPGGGKQFKFSVEIESLLKEGKLKIIDYPQITLKGLIHWGGRRITLESMTQNAA